MFINRLGRPLALGWMALGRHFSWKGRIMEKIGIITEYIRLDAFLKLTGMVDTGGQAKFIIQNGEVQVNGETCTMRGKKLHPGDTASYAGRSFAVAKAG